MVPFIVRALLLSTRASAETTEVIDGDSVDCSALPGDGNCTFESCGCDPYAPGGPCFAGWCDVVPPGGGGGGGGSTAEVCNNGIDDDHDSDVDCEDTDCHAFTVDATADGESIERFRHVDANVHFKATVNSHCEMPLTFSWKFGDGGGGSGKQVNHAYGAPASYTVRMVAHCEDSKFCGTTDVTDSLTVTAYTVDLVLPSADPISQPDPSNEIVLAGTSGRAELDALALVTPASATDAVAPLLRWTLPDLPAATRVKWDPAVDGDPSTGQGLGPLARLEGYPATNDDFGAHTLRLDVVEGHVTVASVIGDWELFFARDDKKTGQPNPNWLRYWIPVLQVQGLLDSSLAVTYGGAPPNPTVLAETPAMTRWTYTAALNKKEIRLFEGAQIQDHGVGPAPFLAGFDLFGINAVAILLLHEQVPVKQVANADALVPDTGPWTNGWSWFEDDNHNHWDIMDGIPGAPKTDDDHDGTKDNLVFYARGELGGTGGNDRKLSTDDVMDWPTAWPMPDFRNGDVNCSAESSSHRRYTSPLETEACREELRSPDPLFLSGQDWAFPGPNHAD